MLFQNSFTENREPDKNEGGRGGGGGFRSGESKEAKFCCKIVIGEKHTTHLNPHYINPPSVAFIMKKSSVLGVKAVV